MAYRVKQFARRAARQHGPGFHGRAPLHASIRGCGPWRKRHSNGSNRHVPPGAHVWRCLPSSGVRAVLSRASGSAPTPVSPQASSPAAIFVAPPRALATSPPFSIRSPIRPKFAKLRRRQAGPPKADAKAGGFNDTLIYRRCQHSRCSCAHAMRSLIAKRRFRSARVTSITSPVHSNLSRVSNSADRRFFKIPKKSYDHDRNFFDQNKGRLPNLFFGAGTVSALRKGTLRVRNLT